MVNNNYQFKNIKPYRVRNMMIKKSDAQPEQSATDQTPDSQPETGQEAEQPSTDVGYINVGVFTASGALPVPNAVVTVYHANEDGEEDVLYHLITDESGRVPVIKLPVEYPVENLPPDYYSTYNLRIQADGYYTYNLLDIQLFPNITTNFRINMIPLAQGDMPDGAGQTFVIPRRPFEFTIQ